mmetsp:Transcript_47806/g.144567  ORF Transcript_47806/g.144567 Transcript_47806/m.144567 type:complete len:237 (-) Transcript_47806:53-763(-)
MRLRIGTVRLPLQSDVDPHGRTGPQRRGLPRLAELGRHIVPRRRRVEDAMIARRLRNEGERDGGDTSGGRDPRRRRRHDLFDPSAVVGDDPLVVVPEVVVGAGQSRLTLRPALLRESDPTVRGQLRDSVLRVGRDQFFRLAVVHLRDAILGELIPLVVDLSFLLRDGEVMDGVRRGIEHEQFVVRLGFDPGRRDLRRGRFDDFLRGRVGAALGPEGGSLLPILSHGLRTSLCGCFD